jgi:hypothetical protein
MNGYSARLKSCKTLGKIKKATLESSAKMELQISSTGLLKWSPLTDKQ